MWRFYVNSSIIYYYQPYKKVFFFDLFCAAIISLVDLAFPQIVRQLTNTLFTQSKEMILHALPFLVILFLIGYIIQSLCRYYVSCQGHIMGAQMERDMRKDLFD